MWEFNQAQAFGKEFFWQRKRVVVQSQYHSTAPANPLSIVTRVDSCKQVAGKALYHSSVSTYLHLFSFILFYINNITKNNYCEYNTMIKNMLLFSRLFEALNKQSYVKWEMGAELGK